MATGIAPRQWAEPFYTVSVCFSKGLGPPVGSAVAGPREAIRRPGGIASCLAAACGRPAFWQPAALYALEHHIERLAEDHKHAARLGQLIGQIDGLSLTPAVVETNIVIFRVDPTIGTPAEFCRGSASRVC